MSRMFQETDSFNQDISDWNTSNVDEMDRMFANSSFDQNISAWCVEQINSKPDFFDEDFAFEDEDSKQPNWGEGC